MYSTFMTLLELETQNQVCYCIRLPGMCIPLVSIRLTTLKGAAMAAGFVI